MKRFYYIFVILLTAILVMSACEGPAGPDGQSGPQGLQGPQGEPGNANVIYSEWMAINWNISDGPNIKQMLLNEPMITEEIVNRGMLLMFARNATLDVNMAVALPFLQGNDYLYFLALNGHETISDGIILIAESVDYSIPVNEFSNTEIRYVIVPGGVPAKMNTEFFEDYEAVTEYYGIPD